MVHEVMVLDHSGFDLAIIKTANNLKFVLFSTLSANCLIPQSLDLWIRIIMFFGIQLVMAAGIGWLESFRARNKMAMNAQYILSINAVALILIFVAMIIKNKI
jgi:formate hydrogenlyase subunit 4